MVPFPWHHCFCDCLTVFRHDAVSRNFRFLSGSKKYTASAKLGFETSTLDMEGDINREAPFSEISLDCIKSVLPKFTGTFLQVPPLYSAIRVKGNRLYEIARKGEFAEEVNIEPRKVHVHEVTISPTDMNGCGLPCFGITVACEGGTYIRSLVRDIGRAVDSAATMTSLVRTKQGQFLLENALAKDEWSPERICAAIEDTNETIQQ